MDRIETMSSQSTAVRTPGPWIVADGWELWPHKRGKSSRSIIVLAADTGEPSICTVADVAPENVEVMERELANARLIAAAPDLLKALEKAEELYQVGLFNAPEGLADEVVKLRHAAIAAAKDGA